MKKITQSSGVDLTWQAKTNKHKIQLQKLCTTNCADDHLVTQRDDGSALLYIDRHLLHEVTSPQAFEGLQLARIVSRGV